MSTLIRRRVFGGAAMALILAGRAFSIEVGDLHPEYTFARTGETSRYRLYIPQAYSSKQAIPLIVMLHGGGGDENTYFDATNIRSIAEQRGYAVLAVRGYGPTGGYGNVYPVVVTRSTIEASEKPPAEGEPVMRAPYRRLGPPRAVPVPVDDYGELAASELVDGRLGRLSEQETFAAIDEVRRTYRIDSRRIYLMGNSMGGTGTLYLAAKFPHMWAAVAPSAGALAAWSYPYARLREAHVPVLFVHGELDEHVNPHWSEVMAASARRQGVDAQLLRVPGGTHTSAFALAMPTIVDFFAHHRRAQPASED